MKAIYVARQQPAKPVQGLAHRPVTAAMSSPVLCVRADTPLGDALRSMVRSGRRHLVVTDETGRCVGVLADRALAAYWAHNPAAFSREPVTTLTNDEPATVGVAARIVDVARLMRGAGDDAVVVVDANRMPVGIVTGTDLIGLLAG